jgi:hypothetical protein
LPAWTQVQRVRSEPAKDEMAAARRRAWFRGLRLRDRSRRARGNGPDSQPAPRMAQPLIPELIAFVAGDELSSIEAPMAVSTVAAPQAIRFERFRFIPDNSKAAGVGNAQLMPCLLPRSRTSWLPIHFAASGTAAAAHGMDSAVHPSRTWRLRGFAAKP